MRIPDIPFSDLLKRKDVCSSICRDVLLDEGLRPDGVLLDEGSRILYESHGGSVLKVFDRNEAEFRDNELLFLSVLQNRLSARVPEPRGSGEHQGYPYLIMEKLEGTPLSRVFPGLSGTERSLLMQQAGRLLRELHDLPVELAEGCRPHWSSFVRDQKANLARNHRTYGLDKERISEIEAFVSGGAEIEETGRTVICHTEVMREHLFVDLSRPALSISGLLDFEPSMIAVPEYDFCAVGVFISCGEPGLFRRFISSYGRLNEYSPLHVMRMLLLHRYSNMKWFISTLPPKLRSGRLEEMADFWFD